MKTLVVCFSWTGRTEAVGRAIAERMDADFELIEDVDDTTSLWKKMLTFVTTLSRGVRRIQPAKYAPGNYPLVIIGTPIWGWKMTPSVRAYLRREAGHFAHVAFFCTEGGSGDQGAFREMEELTLRKPLATLVVRQPDYKEQKVDQLIDNFTEELTKALPPA